MYSVCFTDSIGLSLHMHCVSKSIPDIFDCNLKNNFQILKIFGKNISDKTYHQTHLVSHLTQRLFLHYLGKTQPTKYHIQCDRIA